MARPPEKTEALKQYITRQVVLGRWPPGGLIPSEHDLTITHQISRVTVRRAIDDLIEGGLLVRRHGSGTYVRAFVDTSDIAVLFAAEALLSPQGHVYKFLHAEAERIITSAGGHLQLALGNGARAGRYADSNGVVETILRAGVGGIIGMLFDLAPFRAVIEQRRIPAVCLLGASQPDWAHTVHFDYEAFTRTAAGILSARRIDEYALFTFRYPPDAFEEPLVREEERLLRILTEQARVEVVEVPYSMDSAAAYEVFKQFWARSRRPRTVFFRDDCICDVATRAILELGIRVPEELSILTHLTEGRRIVFPVALDAVGFSPTAAARQSCGLLYDLIRDRSLPPTHLTVPPIMLRGASLQS